jgi:hypothetical protein
MSLPTQLPDPQRRPNPQGRARRATHLPTPPRRLSQAGRRKLRQSPRAGRGARRGRQVGVPAAPAPRPPRAGVEAGEHAGQGRPRSGARPAARRVMGGPAGCQCEVAGQRAATESLSAPGALFQPAPPERSRHLSAHYALRRATKRGPVRRPVCLHPWQGSPGVPRWCRCRGRVRSSALRRRHVADSRCSPAPLPRASVPASCGLPRRLGRHLGYYGCSVATIRW